MIRKIDIVFTFVKNLFITKICFFFIQYDFGFIYLIYFTFFRKSFFTFTFTFLVYNLLFQYITKIVDMFYYLIVIFINIIIYYSFFYRICLVEKQVHHF